MAKKHQTIEVTQADIDRAKRNNSARCVVATAIGKTVEGAKAVSIDLQTIRFTVDGERFVYLTPPAASGYVIAFDAGDPIHPFAFRLSEAYRVHVRQNRRTPAGKERARAVKKATARKQKAESLEQAIPTMTDTEERNVAEAQLVVAQRDAELAEKALQDTTTRLAGEAHWEPDQSPDPMSGGRKRTAPPQTFKRAVRSYGSRQLRINQAPDTPEERAAKAAVTVAYDQYATDDDPGVTL